MPRDHPMLVQHSRIHTQAWRANGDISLILPKSGTDNPSVDDIMATEKYITGVHAKAISQQELSLISLMTCLTAVQKMFRLNLFVLNF